jgi:hypothetical protein
VARIVLHAVQQRTIQSAGGDRVGLPVDEVRNDVLIRADLDEVHVRDRHPDVGQEAHEEAIGEVRGRPPGRPGHGERDPVHRDRLSSEIRDAVDPLPRPQLDAAGVGAGDRDDGDARIDRGGQRVAVEDAEVGGAFVRSTDRPLDLREPFLAEERIGEPVPGIAGRCVRDADRRRLRRAKARR